MTETIAYLSIDYDEGDPKSYRGITLSSGKTEFARWSGGTPAEDWQSYLDWRDTEQAANMRVLENSSITHFFFDIPGWRMIEDDRGREVMILEDRPGHEDQEGNTIPEKGAPSC
ncbi:hypothetical protein KUV57_12180 [Epibacterium sp. DP7N7-1]|nr:hypothetical protein [Epibacterium sp. DP7N7-1]